MIQRRQFLQSVAVTLFAGATGPLRSATRTAEAFAGAGDLDRMAILDQVKPISAEEYRDRLRKVRQRMAEAGFSALLLEPGTNMQYFTGFRFGRSERLVSLVVPAQGEAFFVAPAFEATRFEDRDVVPEVVTWEEHESPYERVFEALRKRQVQSGVLGIGPTARLFVYQGLVEAGRGFEMKLGSDLIDPLRMRKNEHELQLMRAAVAVTEEAIRQAWKRVRSGVTEKELAKELRDIFQQLGNPGGGLVQFAATSAIPHGRSGDRQLREGDVVLIDSGTRVHGYASDITRTAVYRKASPKVEKVWQIVRDAQQAAIDLAKPGVTCEALDFAARDLIEKAGYGKYFVHRLGHGIGMDGHEHPYLVRGNTTRLKPGMTVTIEPGIYLPGEFGVRIEDDVVITDDGCEPLSSLTDRLEVI
jgi:Xaa-Pro dipeptidase